MPWETFCGLRALAQRRKKLTVLLHRAAEWAGKVQLALDTSVWTLQDCQKYTYWIIMRLLRRALD